MLLTTLERYVLSKLLRTFVPVVFAPTGAATPDRIELRSAVFSAGVTVDVPR